LEIIHPKLYPVLRILSANKYWRKILVLFLSFHREYAVTGKQKQRTLQIQRDLGSSGVVSTQGTKKLELASLKQQ